MKKLEMKTRSELKDMTKQELIEEYFDLYTEYEDLQTECNSWIDDYDELEDEYNELKTKVNDTTITDIDNFKRELERAGFMTKRLEDFIEDYLRWDN